MSLMLRSRYLPMGSFLLSTALFSISSFCQIPRLSGKLPGIRSGVIYFINATNKKTDSAAIKEHSFTYRPKTDSPYTSTIYVKYQNTFWGPFTLLIHKQSISVRIDSNSITFLNNNDSINKIYLLFRENHLKFIDSIEKLSSANDAEMKNNYPKRKLLFEAYTHDFFEKTYTHRNNLGTAAALCDFVIKDRLLNIDSVAVLYNILSEINRASNFGIQALQHIAKSTALLPGRKAPNFSVPDLNNKTLTLRDYEGKYVLINFWASWCGPCRNENAELSKQFANTYNTGLDIINISLDGNREKMEAALKEDNLDKFINCIVSEGFSSQIAKAYYLTGIPASYLINKTGTIIGVNLSMEEIKNRIK